MKPEKLNKGDCIGVIAPSNPITELEREDMEKARRKVEKAGFRVKYSKNLFSNTLGYSATAREKAEDINKMFADPEVKMIWCARGGANSNSTFEYIDYELIKNNSKIICGFSDITSITNMIHEKTGLVTFSSTNFKTIATADSDYGYDEVLKRFVDGSLELGPTDSYKTLKEGLAEGELVGGNLCMTSRMSSGKYSINFKDKILFIEEMGPESYPTFVSNFLYCMKQNGVFDQIKGLWIGHYEHESGTKLEDIVMDVLGDNHNFPIVKSNNFGHTDTMTVIPIGTKARIDTSKDIKVELLEPCVE